jgi:hypothetical protein
MGIIRSQEDLRIDRLEARVAELETRSMIGIQDNSDDAPAKQPQNTAPPSTAAPSKAEFWRAWAIEGMPADKQRLAEAAWDAGRADRERELREQEPVTTEFQDDCGRWHRVLDVNYRNALEIAGLWPMRNLYAAPVPPPGVRSSFQARVAPWMQSCFGSEIANDIRERGDRLLEEVLELLQSSGYDPSRVATLRDYVYGRPVGDPQQEAGGVMVTMAAYCLAAGIDMHEAGETELARIWTKIEKIRAKQKTKRGLHTPLPVPPVDALPPDVRELVEALEGMLIARDKVGPEKLFDGVETIIARAALAKFRGQA